MPATSANRFTEPYPWHERAGDPHDFVFAQMVQRGGRQGAHVGLFGAPYDHAVQGRPGARGGPDAIRRELALLKPFTFARGPFESEVADWGNVRVEGESVAEAHASIEDAARLVLRAGSIPLCLGGDHSLAAPLIRAHGKEKPMGVVNLDAHLDLRESDRITSGTPFRQLIRDGFLAPRNLSEVGLRDFATSAEYGKRALAEGVHCVTAEDVAERGIEAVAQESVGHVTSGAERFYLSIDIDVLDQAHAPGVSAPTPGGLTSRELLGFARRFAATGRVAGVCIVETAPSLDARDNRTTRASAWCVMALLAGFAEARARTRAVKAEAPGGRSP